eukprot:UC1_evm3s948
MSCISMKELIAIALLLLWVQILAVLPATNAICSSDSHARIPGSRSSSSACINNSIEGGYGNHDNNKKALVLLDNLRVRDTHSLFLDILDTELGLEIEYHVAGGGSVGGSVGGSSSSSTEVASMALLNDQGEPLYQFIVSLAPTAESLGAGINASILATFVDAGGCLVLTGSTDVGEPLRESVLEFGFEIDAEGSAVQGDGGGGCGGSGGVIGDTTESVIVTSAHYAAQVPILPLMHKKNESIEVHLPPPPPHLAGGSVYRSVYFEGIGLALNPSNALAFPLLTANTGSYSAPIGFSCVAAKQQQQQQHHPFTVGSLTVLVGAMQARNNARVVITGSSSMFSDAFMTHPHAANAAFARGMLHWVLGRTGSIRLASPPVFGEVSGKDTVKKKTTGVLRPGHTVEFRALLEETKYEAIDSNNSGYNSYSNSNEEEEEEEETTSFWRPFTGLPFPHAPFMVALERPGNSVPIAKHVLKLDTLSGALISQFVLPPGLVGTLRAKFELNYMGYSHVRAVVEFEVYP